MVLKRRSRRVGTFPTKFIIRGPALDLRWHPAHHLIINYQTEKSFFYSQIHYVNQLKANMYIPTRACSHMRSFVHMKKKLHTRTQGRKKRPAWLSLIYIKCWKTYRYKYLENQCVIWIWPEQFQSAQQGRMKNKTIQMYLHNNGGWNIRQFRCI